MPKNRACLLTIVVIAAVFAAIYTDIVPAKAGAFNSVTAVNNLERQAKTIRSVIGFWNDPGRGRWMLHLRHAKCWQVKGKQRRKLCRLGRSMLREQNRRLAAINRRIDKLTTPKDTGYLPADEARELGRRMAAKAGWTASQWQCLDSLWGNHESSWRVTADNPRSEAYGIPQALPGSKMGPGWRTSAYVQIKWGLGYVRGRFGSPCSALAFRIANGWY